MTEIRTIDESGARGAAQELPTADRPFGPVAAAFIAAGIGALVLGILTTLAEASETVKGWLEWSKAVGPLSGKTVVAVAAWLVAWAVLHPVLRGREVRPRSAFVLTAVLVAAGIVLTFPPFSSLLAPAE